MPEIEGLEKPCPACEGVINTFTSAAEALADLDSMTPLPKSLSRLDSSIRSTVRGEAAQTKLQLGWKLKRIGEGCPVVRSGGACVLLALAEKALTQRDKALTGLIEWPL